MAFSLEKIVPWGRSFEEYCRMFKLTEDDLNSIILGCGDGPASFNASMKKLGRRMISVDPLYQFSAAQINQRIEATASTVIKQLHDSREDYLWDDLGSPDNLGRVRMAAMKEFLTDYARDDASGNYVAGELPRLPFADNSFDLALCSHLLFLYADHLSFEFHCQAIVELCRVAREVRIFPLADLAGRPSCHLPAVLEWLPTWKLSSHLEQVPYEFQRGANQMLVVTRT